VCEVGLGEGLIYCLILKENLNEFIFNGFTTQPPPRERVRVRGFLIFSFYPSFPLHSAGEGQGEGAFLSPPCGRKQK
jgi:hypothetical protein